MKSGYVGYERAVEAQVGVGETHQLDEIPFALLDPAFPAASLDSAVSVAAPSPMDGLLFSSHRNQSSSQSPGQPTRLPSLSALNARQLPRLAPAGNGPSTIELSQLQEITDRESELKALIAEYVPGAKPVGYEFYLPDRRVLDILWNTNNHANIIEQFKSKIQMMERNQRMLRISIPSEQLPSAMEHLH